MSPSDQFQNHNIMKHTNTNNVSSQSATPALPPLRFVGRLTTNDQPAAIEIRSRRRESGRLFSTRASRLACAVLFALGGFTTVAPAQSLWKDGTSVAMVSDRRARAVGDLLTIIVQENNSASKDNSTKTTKSSSIDASLDTVLFSPAASGFLTKSGKLPALKTTAKQDFDGGGKISNSEKITARIAVRVVDVLPNGNLVIEGRRTTSFSGETQEAVLRGVVRGEDVAPNNSVFSYNVADATIKYISNGSVSGSQRKGWFLRVWDKVTPF